MSESEAPKPGELLRNGKRKAVLEAIRNGNTREAACEAAGIGRSTFYRMLAEDGTLRDAVARSEAEAEQTAVDAILRTVHSNTPQSHVAAAWWLERRRPNAYGRNEKLTILRDTAQAVSEMSDDELLALRGGPVE